MSDNYSIGDHVKVNGLTGHITKIRHDNHDEPIIDIDLDDATATPDGTYIARICELQKITIDNGMGS